MAFRRAEGAVADVGSAVEVVAVATGEATEAMGVEEEEEATTPTAMGGTTALGMTGKEVTTGGKTEAPDGEAREATRVRGRTLAGGSSVGAAGGRVEVRGNPTSSSNASSRTGMRKGRKQPSPPRYNLLNMCYTPDMVEFSMICF